MLIDKIHWRPIIRRIIGGAMKYCFVLLAVCCLLTAVHAQWLETTIQLDSGSVPYALCYNSQNDKVYCADIDLGTVTVIDGATNGITATIPIGKSVGDLCYDPLGNMVYGTYGGDSEIGRAHV
jgi:YVTN family beta-propeller protein